MRWLGAGAAAVLLSGCAGSSVASAPPSTAPPSTNPTTTPSETTSSSSEPAPRSGGTYRPCTNPASARDVAQLYSGVTTAVRARVTDERTESSLAFGAVDAPTPGSEVVLHDVHVLWGQAPSPLTLYDQAPVGQGIPDGEYVLVLMPLQAQRGLYQLGMGLFGAYGVDDAGGLHTYCTDYVDPGWKHQAPAAINSADLVADLTGAFGARPTPLPGTETTG